MFEHYELCYEVRPLTINKERTLAWRTRADIVKEWRSAFYLLAAEQKMPGFRWIEVGASPILPSRRHTQDLGNSLPAVKAAIDGLVDYGVIPDDTDEYVRMLTFYPTVVTKGRTALLLRVVGHERQPKRWTPSRTINRQHAQRMRR